MIFLDSMLFLLNILLSLRLLIHAHILPMLVFTQHPQIQVEVSQMVLILTITGTVQLFQMKFQQHMLFQAWMSIIMGGSTIHLLSLQVAAVLVILISPQFPLFLRELLEQTLICQDLGLLSTHSLSVTGRNL